MNCRNTEGSYDCECMTGFMKSNSSSGCVLTPGTCADGVTICDRNANCRPLGGRRYGCKCRVGFAGDGFKCGTDRDLDGWPDIDLKCSSPLCRQDNCPSIPVIILKVFMKLSFFKSCIFQNSGQEDTDKDGIGDVCDLDIDNDGILNHNVRKY